MWSRPTAEAMRGRVLSPPVRRTSGGGRQVAVGVHEARREILRSAKDSKTTCRADLYSSVVSMNSVVSKVRRAEWEEKIGIRTRIFVVSTTDLDGIY